MARLSVSIENLGNEVLGISPLTTLYYYDDTVHRDSDHDPNPAGVVCACDIMAGHGLDLHTLSRQIVDRRHPDTKYVIYNRQIASRNTGWKWVAYTGKNPHTDHIHVSVGVGPDGYSRQPYDTPAPWGISGGDDMNEQEHSWLENLFAGMFYGGSGCGKAVDAENVVNPTNAAAAKYRNGMFSQLAQIRANQEKILAALGGDSDVTLTQEQLDELAEDVADRLRAITFVAQA